MSKFLNYVIFCLLIVLQRYLHKSSAGDTKYKGLGFFCMDFIDQFKFSKST